MKGMDNLWPAPTIGKTPKNKCENFGLDAALIIAGSQKDANMLALRSPDVSLDSRKARALGFRPPTLAEELARLYKQFGQK